MQSTNFEFLRGAQPELASLGGFAEHYAVSDPASVAIKLRAYAESMVSSIFSAQKMLRPYKANLNDLLNDDCFKAATPRVVIDKLHALRMQGNRAAHGAAKELKPYAGVSTAILVFTKGGRTDNVWFYKVQADGYSLDDKRTPGKDNDIPDLVAQWKARSPKKHTNRAKKAFFIPVAEIRENRYDLSINRYKEIAYEEVQYDPPVEILNRLESLEGEITKDMKDLRKMLK